MQRGDRISGDYLLEAKIGEGAFGEVWSAFDANLKRKVAIKFLKAPELGNVEQGHRAEILARFEREATALAAVSHPNVVTVYGRGKIDPDGPQFIVMEHIEGETLRDWLDNYVRIGERPKPEVVYPLFDQICLGVGALHTSSAYGPIVHRDLKSRNVMLVRQGTREWVAKILDLGVARMGSSTNTRTGQIGTFDNMAPEQGTGHAKASGPPTDVFALGILLTEMVSAEPPPEGQQAWWLLALHGAARVEERVRRDLPPELWGVAMKALATDPADRYANALLLRDDFRAAVALTIGARTGTSLVPSMPVPAPLPMVSMQGQGPMVSMQGQGPMPTQMMSQPPLPPAAGGVSPWLVMTAAAAVTVIVGVALYVTLRPADPTPRASSLAATEPTPTPVAEPTPTTPVAPTTTERCARNVVNLTRAVFRMGDPTNQRADQVGADDEGPVHEVRLSDYAFDRTDVTADCFRRYWLAGHPAVEGPVHYPGGDVAWEGTVSEPLPSTTDSCTFSATPGALDQHPINCVNWATAQAYCVWMNGRLPTEAEWEYAARGPNGGRYPWGDAAPTNEPCWSGGDAPADGTCVVDSHSRGLSPMGAFDMAGNVWQWMADRYAFRYEADGQDPLGTSETILDSHHHPPQQVPNQTRVIRGGSWMFFASPAVRSTLRMMGNPEVRLPTVGFRCAYSPGGQS